MAEDLESIHEDGRLTHPGQAHTYKFSSSLHKLIEDEAKLFGFSNDLKVIDMLFSLFIESYDPMSSDWDLEDLKLALQPRGFIVGTPQRGLPLWVVVDKVNWKVFTWMILSEYSDHQPGTSLPKTVKHRWNGTLNLTMVLELPSTTTNNMGVHPQDVDYWSIGGNSPVSAFEVYKAMGLFD